MVRTVADAAPAVSTNALVVRVIDGDTIVVDLGDDTATVRLMGVDTPETKHPPRPVEFYGPEAAALTEAALSGAAVLLVSDAIEDESDGFGRLLRYVTVCKTWISTRRSCGKATRERCGGLSMSDGWSSSRSARGRGASARCWLVDGARAGVSSRRLYKGSDPRMRRATLVN